MTRLLDPPPEVREHPAIAEISVNGIRLYYEEHGQGDPILCIHGAGSSGLAWMGAMEALSALGRVILYDRRGCTRSERPDPYETTSASEHAADAAALLRALDAAPAVLIGRSYGGDISIELAVTQPELVRAIVLLDGAPPSLDAEAQAWVEELRRVVDEASSRDGSTVTEAFFDMVLGPGVWETFPGELQEMFEGNAQAILAEVRGPMCVQPVEEIAKVDIPVLLMAPTEALPGMDRATERLAAALPDSRIVLVEGGHLIDPAEPRVLDFVGEVVRS